MLTSADEDAVHACSDRGVCSRGEDEEAALLQKASVQRAAFISAGASSATTSSAANTAKLLEPITLSFVYNYNLYNNNSNNNNPYPVWGPAVQLEVPSGTGGPQFMLIDTRSSEIAFCNKTLAEGLTPAIYLAGVLPGFEQNEYCSTEGDGLGKYTLGAGAYGEWWWGYNRRYLLRQPRQ